VEITSVTSKGQVTIPKELRQQLGIRQGSRIEFSLVGDHVEMRVRSSPAGDTGSGFGMLKSRRTAAPTDFDVATLLAR
jgi:AbrB family looped-hinge helix DNA binding protein